jgi:hypothetical protein
MRIEDATQTVGGHPVRIYATDGGGGFPVHGAIWVCTFGEWVTYQWSLNGGFVGRNGEDNSDLDLDLRDENGPKLGLATNQELLEELRTRIEIHGNLEYSTANNKPFCFCCSDKPLRDEPET